MRAANRGHDEIRPVTIERDVSIHAEGSALISMGNTKVFCTASVQDSVPQFLKNSGKGWVTAEYGMLPRATSSRNAREAARGKQGGRTLEIQRLIGRSLRAVTDLSTFGERTVNIDCDVLQADGGTRCASITGAFVALHDAFTSMVKRNLISDIPITDHVAAISVGLVGGRPVLDLDYPEDSTAGVDLNVVMTDKGQLVEIQGTGEEKPFDADLVPDFLTLARIGVDALIEVQKEALRNR